MVVTGNRLCIYPLWITRLGRAFAKVMLTSTTGEEDDDDEEDQAGTYEDLKHQSRSFNTQTKILIGRAFFNLIKIHYRCLNDAKILSMDLAKVMREFYQNEKKMYNWNLQGLQTIQRSMQRQDALVDFKDISQDKAKKRSRRKKAKEAAPILTVI